MWIASKRSHPEAIGCLDEQGTPKNGQHAIGVAPQSLGSRGKVDNGVVGVHLSYSAPDDQCLLDGQLDLPIDWADDPERRRKSSSQNTRGI